jgi:hypothetical protein
MNLCGCVSDEGGDGEGTDSEASSPDVSSTMELVTVCQFGL